jgi:D-beta-D-heptose 7-phosphate kinase/D-beta-D-heptose 1-phosphate adenosyltransferase
VQRLKGPTRPITRLEHRCAVMAAIKYVDCVTSFDEDTPLRLITHLQPDVLFKGADYRPDEVVGADVVTAAGGKVLLLDLVAGQSTTGIVRKIKGGV